MHPLADVVRAAMAGRFPPADGRVETLPTWRRGIEAVVALTGHGYLCLEPGRVAPDHVADLAADAFGGVTDPRLVTALAGPTADRDDIDSLDLVMVAPGQPHDPDLLTLVTADRVDHARADFARRLRDDVRVLVAEGTTDPLVLGRGIAGLTEVSFEVAPERRDHGRATAMLSAARAAVPTGEPLVAAVAPGNAASLRALLSAGFAPVGAVQIWHRPTP